MKGLRTSQGNGQSVGTVPAHFSPILRGHQTECSRNRHRASMPRSEDISPQKHHSIGVPKQPRENAFISESLYSILSLVLRFSIFIFVKDKIEVSEEGVWGLLPSMKQTVEFHLSRGIFLSCCCIICFKKFENFRMRWIELGTFRNMNHDHVERHSTYEGANGSFHSSDSIKN